MTCASVAGCAAVIDADIDIVVRVGDGRLIDSPTVGLVAVPHRARIGEPVRGIGVFAVPTILDVDVDRRRITRAVRPRRRAGLYVQTLLLKRPPYDLVRGAADPPHRRDCALYRGRERPRADIGLHQSIGESADVHRNSDR